MLPNFVQIRPQIPNFHPFKAEESNLCRMGAVFAVFPCAGGTFESASPIDDRALRRRMDCDDVQFLFSRGGVKLHCIADLFADDRLGQR